MFVILVAIIFYLYVVEYTPTEAVACPPNFFKLKGMNSCYPWLSCEDLENITLIKHLDSGAVKNVFLVQWMQFYVVQSIPTSSNYLEDFLNGVKHLQLLNPSDYIVQYVGYCDSKFTLFTEYHPNGNAADYFELKSPKLSVTDGLKFCHQYALILNYLHHGPAGRRVFCDSNSLHKLLSQLLVTYDHRLILNDVDALPEVVDGSGIKCGHRRLEGQFVAPEQLWTKNEMFNHDLLPGYDEKTDIWKAASVCDYFLQRAHGGEVARYKLFDLHSQCKNKDPSLRPSIKILIDVYSSTLEELNYHSEL